MEIDKKEGGFEVDEDNTYDDFFNILKKLKKKYDKGPIKILNMFFRIQGFEIAAIKIFLLYFVENGAIELHEKGKDNLYYRIMV